MWFLFFFCGLLCVAAWLFADSQRKNSEHDKNKTSFDKVLRALFSILRCCTKNEISAMNDSSREKPERVFVSDFRRFEQVLDARFFSFV
jgi:hypothetical protein